MQDSVTDPFRTARTDAEYAGLSARYVRSGEAPAVMVDDKIDGRVVIGFVYNAPPGAVTPEPSYDQVLLDGDAGLPVRPLPEHTDRVERCGLLPPRRCPEMIHDAALAAAGLPDRISRLTVEAPDPAGTFFARLFERVWRLGHLIWAAGGSVRDLIADGEQAKVKDLDFSGTAPPGLMASLVREVLIGMRCPARIKVSPRRVCSALLHGQTEPLLEYKALDLRGFPFPASGGDLRHDARTRDLTVNSVHYDPRHRLILDPTLRGLSDLGDGSVRVLCVPYAHDVPTEQATVLLRLVKFVARWRALEVDVRVEQARGWAAALPDDLFAKVPADGWETLRKADRAYRKEQSGPARAAAAEEIGPMAVRLLAELDAGGGR